ncbi:MAG: hypothetical protein ACJ75Z_14215 [Solirubrobacterales bacterium]
MPSVAPQPDRSAFAYARRALPLAFAAFLLALLLLGARSGAPATAAAQGVCPALPEGLSPPGPGPTRFTMLIRINTQGNVDTYTKPQQGMGDRLRPQDIFVLNTRFGGSANFPAMTSDVAADLAADLRSAFPCNRIIALNGMGLDPSQAGYAFTAIDNPNVYTLLTDFEKSDWEAGRATDPTRPPWVNHFEKAFPVITGWNAGVAATVAANPAGAGKRTGLAPLGGPDWNYGQIAQNLDKLNTRLGAPHLGPQSVQTQDACADAGAAGFGAVAKQLRLQFKFKFLTKKIKVRGKKGKTKTKRITIRRPFKKSGKPSLSNLGMEISFTDSPQASASAAILSTSAAQAAACVSPGLKQGGGAFFFFASDDAMRQFFEQPLIAALRPPGASSSGSTGGVHP